MPRTPAISFGQMSGDLSEPERQRELKPLRLDPLGRGRIHRVGGERRAASCNRRLQRVQAPELHSGGSNSTWGPA